MVWRSLPVDPGADDPEVGPRRASASLGRLAASLGVPPPAVLTAVFARWEEAVGREVAAHARPLTLRDGLLVVVVDNPAWATQLSYLRGDLLERLREVAGPDAVRDVEVRVSAPGRSRRISSAP